MELSTLDSCSLNRLYPLAFLFHNLVVRMKTSGLLHHGADGTVFFLSETDGLLHRSRFNFETGDHVMNSYRREHLWRTLSLIGLNPHFISGNLLVVLLAENGDDIKCCTPSQPDCHQFDRLGTGASGGIVN